MGDQFEWDEEKAQSNLRKHRISFLEAATVFQDPSAIVLEDSRHSEDEDRFLVLGFSGLGRLLVVLFTDRSRSIRLISARRATQKERRSYEEES